MSRLMRVALATLVLVSFGAVSGLGKDLPSDPDLVRGELDNGLRYVVRKHSVPPGRATMWIHMHTGALNETDRQRGIAHYTEHMAFNGSDHFKPGELVPFFQSLGMTFGRDQNAYTSFDQTTYQLSLPDTKPETLGKGMNFFSDVVHGLALLPAEIDNERQIILEERRRGLSGRQRTQQYVFEHLYPGSLFGFRIPIGTEETIKSVNEQDFKDYYGKWYCASNATLMVVADTDPQEVIKVIKEKFSDAPKCPRPTPQDLKVTAYDKSFAVVTSDSEIRSAEVQIVRVEPVHPPVKTVEQYRDRPVLNVADTVMNRRLGEKVSAGKASYLSASVGAGDEARALHSAEISARANAGKWKDALNEVALDVQTARAFGFTQHELERVNKELI